MFTVIIFAILALADAAIYKDGPCPAVDAVKNLNMSAYADGVWWEVAKYPNDFEDKGDCAFLAFKREDGVIKFQLGEVAEKHFESFDGYVDFAPNAGSNALLDYNSLGFTEKEKTTIMSVYVIAVDYDKYFVGYECRFDEAKKQRHEYAWIKSRTKVLDASTKAAIDKVIKSSLIEADKLIWDKFDEETCKVKP